MTLGSYVYLKDSIYFAKIRRNLHFTLLISTTTTALFVPLWVFVPVCVYALLVLAKRK